jgi:hypothetical protein
MTDPAEANKAACKEEQKHIILANISNGTGSMKLKIWPMLLMINYWPQTDTIEKTGSCVVGLQWQTRSLV